MNMLCRNLFPVLILLGTAGAISAQQPPSYAKQVKPFLAKYCLECHNAATAKGDLVLESVATLVAGGKNGPALVPGKADESRVVLQVEGKVKPRMPPSKAKQPSPQEVTHLRAWVAAGAKDDSATVAAAIPSIKPRVARPAPVTALAYRPDGKLLAAGAHQDVFLIDPANGDSLGKLPAQAGRVTALAFNRGGQRLAVASGAPGRVGEVRNYALSAAGLPASESGRVPTAHTDVIYDLAFSPDGKLLATGGYDRLIKLWDVASGKELRVLKDHSDTVYALAFHPRGHLLASAAADRAVKVWDVATGARLYTLGEATDWVYAAAWSPDGRYLAAGGIDKSIRIWKATAAGAKIVHSVFAHERPITRLVYAADGKTLYSLSEDRTLKAWDTARMVERKVYARQPEAVLALAVRPDHKQLALGRYDGRAILLEEATGKVQSEPVPVKPKPPQLTRLTPSAGQRGQTIRVTFEGKYLENVVAVLSSCPGVAATVVPAGQTANSAQADVTFPATTPGGIYKLGIKTAAGETAQLPFAVDLFPTTTEVEPNDAPGASQRVNLAATLVGTLARAGDVDFYRFRVEAGQQVGAQAVVADGAKLDPVLRLTDLAGRVLVEGKAGVVGYTCPNAGEYTLSLHDLDYRGGTDLKYRLQVGPVPVVAAVFPLGLQRGTETPVQLEGVYLGSAQTIRVKAPADAALGTRLPVPINTPTGTPLGNASVVVGEFPEVNAVSGSAAGAIPVPGTANGRIDQPGTLATWRFAARKGQRLILEVNARRLGSPLDSFLEVLDAKGQPVPRAVLRSQARTYTVFRDHDSAAPGIRIEAWTELAINDYLYVGSELIRIDALPKNPDDDCRFFSVANQRIGYLDTTPTFHPLGEPMYKVSIHAPGTTFPPNGFPVITLDYRNDDGGPGYGKDSRLFFDAPADGDYQVRIGDARGQGGLSYAYRLTVRPPRPGFNISFKPTSPAVWKGGAIPITVTAERLDGFTGAIDVRLENLPPGLQAPSTTIPAEENSTALALFAEAPAVVPDKAPPLKVVARATIEGQEVVREAAGGAPRVVDPGDLLTTTEQAEVTVQPGGEVRLTATIERRNGFKGRVPLDVRGLPHGVRVLDIGLNGILITERESRRTFVIYCEPWVQPMTHPFVVLARREGKNTEHAARSVLLRIGGKP